jgi:hypothetical protein
MTAVDVETAEVDEVIAVVVLATGVTLSVPVYVILEGNGVERLL